MKKSPEQIYWWNDKEILCESGEKVIGYTEYLKTNHWKDLRIAIFRRDEHKCRKCGKLLELCDANVHHLTYEHLGHEWKEDLILLCPECHKKIHGKKVKPKKTWKDKTWKKATHKE